MLTIAPEGIATAQPDRSSLRADISLLSGTTTRQGFVSLADQMVVSATNFLTGVIIGRACAKEEFGLYLLGLSIVFFFTSIPRSLIDTPYTVFSHRLDGSKLARLTGSTLLYQLGLSAIAMATLAAAGTIVSFGVGPRGLPDVLWALAAAILFISVREHSRRVCFARLWFKSSLVVDSCVAVVQLGGLLLLAHYGWLSARSAFWTIGIACGVVAVIWLISVRTEFAPRFMHALGDLGYLWSFGKWIFMGNMVFLMSRQLYPWLLTGFHGTRATGDFAAAWAVVSMANPLVQGAGNFLGPWTAHVAPGGPSKIRSVVFMSTILLAAAMGLFCLALFVFGNQLIVLIYGDRYTGNGAVVSVLALSVAAQAIASAAAYGLWAFERPKAIFKVNVIALGVTLTLGLGLVAHFGPLGAAFGLLAGSLAVAAGRFMAFARLVRPSGSTG